MYTHTQQVTKKTDTTTNKIERTHTTRERMRDTTNRWVKKGKKAQQERQMMDGWMDGRKEGWKKGWMEQGIFFFLNFGKEESGMAKVITAELPEGSPAARGTKVDPSKPPRGKRKKP